MNNLLANTPPDAVRASVSDFPTPRLYTNEYGYKRAICPLCAGEYQPSGYNRHFKNAHIGLPKAVKEKNPRIRRPRRKLGFDPFVDDVRGEWYWKKLSDESIARILANYPR